jgi:hypothetical protein
MIRVTDEESAEKAGALGPQALEALKYLRKVWTEAEGFYDSESGGCPVVPEHADEIPRIEIIEWVDWKHKSRTWILCQVLSDGGDADLWIVPSEMPDQGMKIELAKRFGEYVQSLGNDAEAFSVADAGKRRDAMIRCDDDVPVAFEELLGVTFHGFGGEAAEPESMNRELPPTAQSGDAGPRSCVVGEPWLVQCSGPEGASLREALLGASWVFEEMVPELLEGLACSREGTRALRRHARALGPEADERPSDPEMAPWFNVWYRCRPAGRRKKDG